MPTDPQQAGKWGLVGDGTATLIAALMARYTILHQMLLQHSQGWKNSVSIKQYS